MASPDVEMSASLESVSQGVTAGAVARHAAAIGWFYEALGAADGDPLGATEGAESDGAVLGATDGDAVGVRVGTGVALWLQPAADSARNRVITRRFMRPSWDKTGLSSAGRMTPPAGHVRCLVVSPRALRKS